jgi:hypothetical protein
VLLVFAPRCPGACLDSAGALAPYWISGLRRNKLTHKHIDLKDLFYAEVKACNGIPASEIKLRKRITALEARIASLRPVRDDYRSATETFARAVRVLTVENAYCARN